MSSFHPDHSTADQTIIRSAIPADANRLSVLCDQLGYAASPLDIKARLNSLQEMPKHAIWVAQNTDVVGWIHAHECPLLTMPTQVVILGLVVDPAFRNLGIGRKLVQRVEAWAIEHGNNLIIVRSNVIRHEAHRFYETLGYRLIKQSMVFTKSLAPVSNQMDREPRPIY